MGNISKSIEKINYCIYHRPDLIPTLNRDTSIQKGLLHSRLQRAVPHRIGIEFEGYGGFLIPYLKTNYPNFVGSSDDGFNFIKKKFNLIDFTEDGVVTAWPFSRSNQVNGLFGIDNHQDDPWEVEYIEESESTGTPLEEVNRACSTTEQLMAFALALDSLSDRPVILGDSRLDNVYTASIEGIQVNFTLSQLQELIRTHPFNTESRFRRFIGDIQSREELRFQDILNNLTIEVEQLPENHTPITIANDGLLDESNIEKISLTEIRVSIADYTQLKGLYSILECMKDYVSIPLGGGIHIHVDFSEYFSEKNVDLAVKWMTNHLDRVIAIFPEYKGTYNKKKVGNKSKGTYVNFSYHKSIEFRIAPLTYNYETLIKWIIGCQKVVSDLIRECHLVKKIKESLPKIKDLTADLGEGDSGSSYIMVNDSSTIYNSWISIQELATTNLTSSQGMRLRSNDIIDGSTGGYVPF